ncbi:MAG TPA: ABC transporter permease subunit, partial [Candidatus Limnocylindria bacterium]|nr:ABC transporter permease subunit [Candidatus Limnocylindria bacterium]
MSWDKLWPLLLSGLGDTLYMTIPSAILSYLVGMPLGILLVVTSREGIRPMPRLNGTLGVAVNFLRSIPFIILLALLFPVTRAVMGRAIGTRSLIFPLVISAFPYVARMVEGSIREVDRGVIEAAQSMGSTNWQ